MRQTLTNGGSVINSTPLPHTRSPPTHTHKHPPPPHLPQADAALLLVDGSPGGFEAGFGSGGGGGELSGGQTREHAQLARSLGIEQMAVVVSKLDTVRWFGTAAGWWG
eukprot:108036-Chlamydomonas_euryale.AAC.1